ncbi:hypothetical protein SANTM175S_03682 [Streptomyces antimycoticus]
MCLAVRWGRLINVAVGWGDSVFRAAFDERQGGSWTVLLDAAGSTGP